MPPLRSGLIARSRLFKGMDEGFDRKLTLLSAPAGFGKTSLVVDWLRRQNIPAVWFSADKSDADAMQFLTYVITGLQSLDTSIGKAALTMLQSPQPLSYEAILANLINDIIGIEESFAFVIDDYQAVDTRQIHDMIEFFLAHLPKQMHLIIATRSDPPLRLARLRGQNQLMELRASELSFTIDETAIFFNKWSNLNLSKEDIDLLETRTEGWIAGLQLAALSLKGHENPSGFLKRFKGDNRYIADYLMEEVLSRQPEYLQDFLLQTSILRRFRDSLCDVVTERKNSRRILDTLEKANLFVVPLDDARCWYRYHQLFSDLLQQRLHSWQGKHVAALLDRASGWFARNGYKREAVDYALQAENYYEAARLIEDVAEMDWDRGQQSQCVRWINRLPGEYLESNPNLCIFYARELYRNGRIDDAEERLHAAEQMLDTACGAHTDMEGLRGRIAVIRAFISTRTGDSSRTVHFASQALKSLPQKDLNWRSVAATMLGFGYGSDRLVEAQQAFSQAIKISKAADNVYYHIFAGSCLGSIMLRRGKLKEAKDVNQQFLRLAIENRIEKTGIAGTLYTNLGMIFCEWNDFDEGLRLINRGLELSESGRDPLTMAMCQISLLRAFMYRMDVCGALKLIDSINERADKFPFPPFIKSAISSIHVFFMLASGNLSGALKWAQERGLGIDDELDDLHEMEYVALTNILVAQRRLNEADRLLQRLIENAKVGDRVYMMIDMRLTRVLIYTLKANMAGALAELKKALSLAEPGGFIMMFASKGKHLAELLEEICTVGKADHDAAKAGFSLSYAKKILSACKAGTHAKIEGLMDPISKREMEVLHLTAAGLSNREIAEKLFISLNTVKTHTKNINSKLNVNSRTKAVVRAKEIGIL